jgi:hypothetical protein
VCGFPRAIEVSGDRKTRLKVLGQLEGRQAWASDNDAYQALLFSLLALVAFGWAGHK